MHDLAHAERHIGDETPAREHIQDRTLRHCPTHAPLPAATLGLGLLFRQDFGAKLLPSYLITALTVACALFMENLDSTVISTSLPAIAKDLHEDPFSLFLGPRFESPEL